MLTYYNADWSPNCVKTAILLRELGLDYTQKDFAAGEDRADFVRKFPNAKLPALQDDEVRIAESCAIALYLADKTGRLIPSSPVDRALMYQALSFEAALLAPVIGGFGIFGELGKPESERDTARVARLMPEAQRVAGVLGAVLGDRPYFAGEYSIADIQIWPGTTKAIRHEVFADPPANLVAWDTRMRAREAVREACQGYPLYRD